VRSTISEVQSTGGLSHRFQVRSTISEAQSTGGLSHRLQVRSTISYPATQQSTSNQFFTSQSSAFIFQPTSAESERHSWEPSEAAQYSTSLSLR